MALIEIDDVISLVPGAAQLAGASVELPEPHSENGAWWIPLAGWVLGRDEPVHSVSVVHQEVPVKSVPVALDRADVGRAYPGIRHALSTGFSLRVGASSLPETFVLRLEAGFADGRKVPFALIRGRRGVLRGAYEPELVPVAVTSLGRSGSTLLMAMLAEHPEVVVSGGFPFASRPAGYWLHALRVLADPADRISSAHPDTFQENMHWVGNHPFNDAPSHGGERVEQWFGREYVTDVATFCQRSIDHFYTLLASGLGLDHARFFAEKHEPGSLSRTLSGLYPDSREILLVRDFRDMACSMLAFHERGRVSYGRDRVATDEDFIISLAPAVARLVSDLHEQEDRLHLLRYEELVASPSKCLGGVLEYLGAEADDELVDRIAAHATADSPALHAHRTTSDIAASVGRYRTEMAPTALAAAEEAFGPALETFGYELGREPNAVPLAAR